MKTISKFIFALLSTATFASCTKEIKPKSPVVLVHGAWQGDYVWDKIVEGLKASGHPVSVVKLPAHGSDNTPAYQVSFKAYVEQVKSAVNAYNEPVILVGHSLGGAIITQASAELPQKIGKLVYVAGFIPVSGKSVLEYSQMDAASLLGPAIRLSEDQTEARLANPAVDVPSIFAQDASDAQKQYLVGLYKAEPTIPLATPLSYVKADFEAAGEKYYIHTTADKAISYSLQQKMVNDAGIVNTYSINSGHSPFISAPASLMSILMKILNK